MTLANILIRCVLVLFFPENQLLNISQHSTKWIHEDTGLGRQEISIVAVALLPTQCDGQVSALPGPQLP